MVLSDLTSYLLLSWTIVIACQAGGIRISGKVIYFTAIFPVFVMVFLLVAGLRLPGSIQGIMLFITPSWSKLLDVKIWKDAATQMFFSLGVGFGPLIMYSSFNEFHQNIFRDAIIVTIVDTAISIISGLVVFSVLGVMSYELKVDINKVVRKGPGLVFVAYPEALSPPLPSTLVSSFLLHVMD